MRTSLAAHPRLSLALNAGVLFALFYGVCWHKLDPDFGWHLQAGNYIRTHGIPSHDIFTYSAGQFPWINHEWANDVIVSLLYGAGGYGLLSALYAALWSAGLLVAGVRARLSVLLLAAVAVQQYAGVRPIAWTILFLAITLRLLRSERRNLVGALPLLFIIWANLHAGFIIGLALIAYSAVYDKRPRLIGVLVACAAATCLNAYGPRLYVEVARTLYDPALHKQVAEWASFAFPYVSLLFVVAWGAGGVLFEKQSVKLWLRPSVLLLAAATSASRNIPLFIVTALYECNQYITEGLQIVRGKLRLGVVGKSVVMLAGIVALLGAAYILVWPISSNREAIYPEKAVAFLQAQPCSGHIFNDYNYGGYLIWRLPSEPVYIDGRMPSWKDPSGQKYLTHYYDLLAHPKSYHAEFQKYDIQCVLLGTDSRNNPLLGLLRHDHWRTAVQANHATLLLAPVK